MQAKANKMINEDSHILLYVPLHPRVWFCTHHWIANDFTKITCDFFSHLNVWGLILLFTLLGPWRLYSQSSFISINLLLGSTCSKVLWYIYIPLLSFISFSSLCVFCIWFCSQNLSPESSTFMGNHKVLILNFYVRNVLFCKCNWSQGGEMTFWKWKKQQFSTGYVPFNLMISTTMFIISNPQNVSSFQISFPTISMELSS